MAWPAFVTKWLVKNSNLLGLHGLIFMYRIFRQVLIFLALFLFFFFCWSQMEYYNMKKTNVSVLVFVSDQKLIYMTSFQVKKLKMLSASDLIHLLFAQLHSGRDFGRHEQAPEILLGNLIFFIAYCK